MRFRFGIQQFWVTDAWAVSYLLWVDDAAEEQIAESARAF